MIPPPKKTAAYSKDSSAIINWGISHINPPCTTCKCDFYSCKNKCCHWKCARADKTTQGEYKREKPTVFNNAMHVYINNPDSKKDGRVHDCKGNVVGNGQCNCECYKKNPKIYEFIMAYESFVIIISVASKIGVAFKYGSHFTNL